MNVFFKKSFLAMLSLLCLILLSNNALAASKTNARKPLRDPAPGQFFTFSKAHIKISNSINTPPKAPTNTPTSTSNEPDNLNGIKKIANASNRQIRIEGNADLLFKKNFDN